MLRRALPAVAYLVFFAVVAVALLRWEANGWPPYFWILGAVITGVIRAPYAREIKSNVIEDDKKGLSETILLAGMFLAMGLFPLIHLATGVFSFADYSVPRSAHIVGALLQAPFLWLFWRSHADLGKNWSPTLEVREDHGLITTGVYTHIRHPMYAAIWLGAIAQPLLIENFIAGCLVIPAFLAMHIIRIPREEAMMRERFGDAYDDYMKRTGRIFPKIGSLREGAVA